MSTAEPPVKRKREETDGDDIMSSGIDSKDQGKQVQEETRSASPDMFSEDSAPSEINEAGKQNLGQSSFERSFSDSFDMFPDFSTTLDLLENSVYSEAERSTVQEEPKKDVENVDVKKNKSKKCLWRGVSLEELRGSPLFSQMPPVKPSRSHTVLCQVTSLVMQASLPPESEAWDSSHVRMPFSSESLYPVTSRDGRSKLCSRWELVKKALSKNITSSIELESAMLSYNSKYSERWDFFGLHYFFSDVLEPPEAEFFYDKLLPSITQLALQLPVLINHPIPLLRQHQNHSISLSQLQIASLLANALLCTFPRRNTAKRDSEYAAFPDINFNRLYGFHKNKANKRGIEKLKCLFHYFRRVCHSAPEGVVTFTRQYIPADRLPQWENSTRTFTKFHVSSKGTIEDEGYGMLQMDFANKKVGGGVLGWGCVQEEIRFVICPELIISRLFTESLDVSESLLICGCERFSNYVGYADNFEWEGSHVDSTPRDSSGRRMCAIVAIDALALRYPSIQFQPQNLKRELNKAYAGFRNSDIPSEQLAPVATGNWGCGAYRGNSRLKALLQLMAAAQTGRSLAYFTFGDEALCDDIFDMYTFLKDRNVTVGRLWNVLSLYYDQCYLGAKWIEELYPFVKRIIEPSISSPLSGPGRGCDKQRFYLKKEKKAKSKESKSSKKEASPQKSPGKASPPLFCASTNSLSSSKDEPIINKRTASQISNDSQKTDDTELFSSDRKRISEDPKCVQQSAKEIAHNSQRDSEDSRTDDRKEDYKTPVKKTDLSDGAAGSSTNKTSLLDSLEMYDSAAAPKRKISDYFSVVNSSE